MFTPKVQMEGIAHCTVLPFVLATTKINLQTRLLYASYQLMKAYKFDLNNYYVSSHAHHHRSNVTSEFKPQYYIH